ncbi:MAG TPA: hypothetical protein VM532_07630 [Burkholderiales bacterium]|nr:hypothetical protein [Burkholderiales bacterium]
MSDAEVMTSTILAALHFGANLARVRLWLRDAGFILSHAERKPLCPPLARPARRFIQ